MGNQVCHSLRYALEENSNDPLAWTLASSEAFNALDELSPEIRDQILNDFTSQFKDAKLLGGMASHQKLEFDYQTAALKDMTQLLQGQPIEQRNTRLEDMAENSLWSNTLEKLVREGSSQQLSEETKNMLAQQILRIDQMVKRMEKEQEKRSERISSFEEEATKLIEEKKKATRDSSMSEGKRNLVLIMLKDLLTDIVDAHDPDRADLLEEILFKVSSFSDLIDASHTLNDCEREIAEVVEEMISQLLNLIMLQTDNLSTFSRIDKDQCQKTINFVCSLTVYLSQASISLDTLAKIMEFGLHRHFEIRELANTAKDNWGMVLGPLEACNLIDGKLVLQENLLKTRVMCDGRFCYFHNDDAEKMIKVASRSDNTIRVTFLSQIHMPTMNENYRMASFAERCWMVNMKGLIAHLLTPGSDSGLGAQLKISDEGISEFLKEQKDIKLDGDHNVLVAIGEGDSPDTFNAIIERKVNFEGASTKILIISKQKLSEDLTKATIVSNKVITKDGRPLILPSLADSKAFFAFIRNIFMIQSATNKVDLIDLNTGEYRQVNCRTDSLVSNDQSIRWSGYDSVTGRLLSLNNDFYLRERHFILAPLENADQKKSAGEKTVSVDIPKLAESFGLIIEGEIAQEESQESAVNKVSNTAAIVNIKKAVLSVVKQAFGYYSLNELVESDEAFSNITEFKKVAQQKCFELKSRSFTALQTVISASISLENPEINSQLLTLMNIYMEELDYLQDYRTSKPRIVDKKTVFYFRMALENMAKLDVSKLSIYQKAFYDRNLIRCLKVVVSLSETIKQMDHESFLGAFISDHHHHCRSNLNKMLFDLTYDQENSRVGPSTAILLRLSEKTLEAATEILAAEEKHLRSGPSQLNLSLSYEHVRRRFNIESILMFLIRNQSRLPESITSALMAFGDQLSERFLNSLPESIKTLKFVESNSMLNDYFLFSTLLGHFFYRYMSVLMSDSSDTSNKKVNQFSEMFISAVKNIKMPPVVKTETADADITVELNIEESDTDPNLALSARVSLPQYTELDVETVGFDPQLDTAVVFSCHKVPQPIVNDDCDPDLVVVPYAYLHRNMRITVPFNEVIIALRTESTRNVTSRKIAVKFKKASGTGSSSSAIDSLMKICLNNSMRTTSLFSIQSAELIETKQRYLIDAATQSPLFFNGINFEHYKPAKIEESAEGTTTLQKCEKLYEKLLEKVGILEHRQEFEHICTELQASNKKKSLYAELMGELGFLLNKSAFALTLYHDSLLNMLSNRMFTAQAFDQLWTVCSMIRVISRSFDSDFQFEDLFSKMYLLASIAPNENVEDACHTLLVPTRSIMEAISPVKNNMMAFFETVGIMHSISSNKTTSDKVSDNVVKFLSIKTHTADIVNFLEQKHRLSKHHQESLELIEVFMMRSGLDFSAGLVMLNSLFRKQMGFIDYISPDYSGLPQAAAQQSVRSIQKIVNHIMQQLCFESNSDKQTFLLAIDSLKWLWRSQETYCVASIDVQCIADNNLTLSRDPDVQNSLIELSGSILKFWAANFSDMKVSKATGTDYEVLRTFELVVSSTIKYLQTVIGECLDQLDSLPSLNFQNNREEWCKNQSKIKDFYLADMIAFKARIIGKCGNDEQNQFFEVANINHLDYIDGQRTITDQSQLQKKEEAPPAPVVERQASATSGVGWLFDCAESEADNDKDKVKPETVKQEAALETEKPSKLYNEMNSWFTKNMTGLNQVSSTKNALSQLLHFIETGREKSSKFFDNHMHEILTRASLGEYPTSLCSRATSVQDLALTYHENMPDLSFSKVFDALISKCGSIDHPGKAEIVSSRLGLLRNLLHASDAKDTLSNALNGECPKKKISALEVIDPTYKTIQTGELVYRAGDAMKEPYMVIEKTPAFSAQCSVRNHLHLTSDLRLQGRYRDFVLGKRSVNSSILAISTRTKNFRWFDVAELSVMDPAVDREKLRHLVEDLNLDKIVGDTPASVLDLYVFYRLTEIANLLPGSKLRSKLEERAKKMNFALPSSNHMALNVMQQIVNSFMHSSEMKTFQDFKIPVAQLLESYSGMKSKVYSMIRGNRLKSSPITASPTTTLKDQNLKCFTDPKKPLTYSWTTADSAKGTDLSPHKLASMINELISRILKSWTKIRKDQKISAEAIRDHWKVKDLQSLIHVLEDFPSIIPQMLKQEGKVQETLAHLIGVAVEVLESPKLGTEIKTTKVFGLIVELISELNYHCPKHSVAVEGAERTLDRILQKVMVNDHLDSGSLVKSYGRENLQNVILLVARHAMRFMKYDADRLEHGKTHRWLTIMNDKLSAVCQPDDQQENTIVKGIFTWMLLKEKEDLFTNPWAVCCLPTVARPELKLGNYRNWMLVVPKDTQMFYSLYDKADSKVPIKCFAETSDQNSNDLSIQSRFEVEPGSAVFVEPSLSLDYHVPKYCGEVEHLGSSFSQGSTRLTSFTSCYLIKDGKAYFCDYSSNRIYGMFSGVSLVGRHEDCGVMYLEESKELAVYLPEYEKKMPLTCPRVMNRGDSQNDNLMIDLSSLPKMTSILAVNKGFFVLLKAVDGSLVFVQGNPDDNSSIDIFSKCVKSMLRLMTGKPESQTSVQVSVELFRTPYNVTYMANTRNSCLVEVDKRDTRELVYFDRNRWIYATIQIGQARVTKLVGNQNSLYALLDTGQLFTTENLEFEASGSEEKPLFIHIEKPFFKRKDVKDIELWSDRDIIAIVKSEKTGELTIEPVSSDPQANLDCCSYSGYLTDESKLMPFILRSNNGVFVTNLNRCDHYDMFKLLSGDNRAHTYPAALCLIEDSIQCRSIQHMTEITELASDIFAVQSRPVYTMEYRWSEFFSEYAASTEAPVEQREFNEQDLTTAKCIYWSPSEGVKGLAEIPKNLEDLGAYVFLVSTKTTFKPCIGKQVEKLAKGIELTSWNSGKNIAKINFFPDFHNMTSDEFAHFKEELRSAWEPHYEEFRSNYSKYKEIIMIVAMKNLDNDPEDRSFAQKLLRSPESFRSSYEYRRFERFSQEPIDQPTLDKIICCLQVLNTYYADYFLRLPVFEGRCLDPTFNELSEKNAMAIFFLSQFKPNLGSSTVSMLTVNKFKALKHSSLKNQNFSLLNQYIQGFDSITQKNSTIRSRYDLVKFSFVGEGKLILKQAASTLEVLGESTMNICSRRLPRN